MVDYDNSSDGSIKNHVPDKGISEITLDNLRLYDDAARMAKTGIPKDPSLKPRNHNEMVENRFEGLVDMIALQAHIISGHNMATVEKNCLSKWNKQHKEDKDKINNKFEEEDNDINTLKDILVILQGFEEDIEKSVNTPTHKDDFVIIKIDGEGNKRKQLTQKFYTVHNQLISLYRDIYGILQENKIVTLGVSQDIDKTEQEKEEELKRRILQS
jgi:hypothetical protein